MVEGLENNNNNNNNVSSTFRMKMVHKCILHLHHMNSPLHTCVSVHSRDMYTCGVTLGDNRKGNLKKSRRLQNRTQYSARSQDGVSAALLLQEDI